MTTHDLLGIGAGPFNLGLAALAEPLPLTVTLLEARPRLEWHPGAMIEGATIQVPFLADLVTMADPTSPLSFLSFLKQTGRLYPFYIREDFHPLRAEYDAYCRWAGERLSDLRLGHAVERVEAVAADEPDAVDGAAWRVTARTSSGTSCHLARHLVLGVGTAPHIPEHLRGASGALIHSADYLPHREMLESLGHVTVVGSGQSAAEIYHDLLQRAAGTGRHVAWVTRSPRFFPMEYTKLTLEMTSPEYAAYHRALPSEVRDGLGRSQRALSKGISAELVDEIYDTLYRIRVETGCEVPTTLVTSTEVREITPAEGRDGSTLHLHHEETGQPMLLDTDGVVLATGYAPRVLPALEPIRALLRTDSQGRLTSDERYRVDLLPVDAERGRVYQQNGDDHVQSFISPDLGMGAYRSSVILADLLADRLGGPPYPIEQRIAFQEFGVPRAARRPSTAEVGR